MPNGVAYLALLAWPVVTFALIRTQGAARGLILSLLLGYLFLPEPPAAFDFPLIPPLTKHTIPALAAALVLLLSSDQRASWMPESGFVRVLIIIFIVSPVFTTLTNMEVTYYEGSFAIQGLSPKDAIAQIIQQVLLILPFLMARTYLRTAESQRDILILFMKTGLIYSLFMLVEIRLSPQLNNWIYGYFQHQFGQSIRGGGYRPTVFLYHGLWVAFFCMTASISALALWRMDRKNAKLWYLLAGLYLFAILVLAKSLGSLLFALLLVPVVLLLPGRLQITLAVVLSVIALGYPLLKGMSLVPEKTIVEQAAKASQDRAQSVKFRFDNENVLLDRAAMKPIFGWGSWGRNQVYDGQTGQLLTVTDGRWIITIGVYGWLGFLAEFGIILLPIFFLWRESSKPDAKGISPFVPALSLLLAINVVDMIPNATLTPLTWMLAGALIGYAEELRSNKHVSEKVSEDGRKPEMKWKPVI